MLNKSVKKLTYAFLCVFVLYAWHFSVRAAESPWYCEQLPSAKWECVPRAESNSSLFIEASTNKAVIPSEWIEHINDDDWNPHATSQVFCQGKFQPPIDLSAGANTQNNLAIEADESEISNLGTSTLKGNVFIRRGERVVRADQALIFRNESQMITHVNAIGRVTELEPNLKLSTEHLTFQFDPDKLLLENTEYHLYQRQARGQAQLAELSENDLTLYNANYTTCPPTKSSWHIHAKKLLLDKNSGRGQAYNATLWVRKVPILYTPYFNFPVDSRRKTGFLFPDVGSNERLGFTVAVPFYWNMAPNYDFTFTPKLLTKRGVEFENYFRYLTQEASGNIHFVINPSDHEYRAFRRKARLSHPGLTANDPRVTGLDNGNTRYGLSVQHMAHSYYGIHTYVDYNYVSDENYLFDYGGSLAGASTTQLLQQGSLIYKANTWHADFTLQNYQVLHPFSGPVGVEPYRLLPKIGVSAQNTDPILHSYLGMDVSYTNFEHKRDPITNKRFTEGTRFIVHPSIWLPIQTPSFFVIPKVQYDYAIYDLSPSELRETLNKPNHPERHIPIFTLDTGTHYQRTISTSKQPWIQTLNPRIFYLYVPNKNQSNIPNFDSGIYTFSFSQLFRDNRFTGGDRIGDAKQISLALTTTLISPNTYEERFAAGIGNTYHFNERNITLCDKLLDANCLLKEQPKALQDHSSIAAFVDYRLTDNLNFRGDIEYDIEQSNTDKQFFIIQYKPNPYKVINLEYQYLRIDPAQLLEQINNPVSLKQSVISWVWPVTASMRFVGNWNYDWENHRSIVSLAGIEWESCCTAFRLVGKRYLEPNAPRLSGIESNNYNFGVYLQFVFKGLAPIGNKRVDKFLKEHIAGYKTYN